MTASPAGMDVLLPPGEWRRIFVSIAACSLCRPADRTALDEDMQIIGVPSDVPSEMDASGRYYFAFVVASDTPSTRTSSMNASAENMPQVSLMEWISVNTTFRLMLHSVHLICGFQKDPTHWLRAVEGCRIAACFGSSCHLPAVKGV